MGFFNFFGDGEHRVFNYRPIYYDKAEDERRKRFGAVDGSLESPDKPYVPGSYIKGSMRDGAYKNTRTHLAKTQKIIGIVSLILIFIVLYYIAKFYSML